jgi:hypothetical protein
MKNNFKYGVLLLSLGFISTESIGQVVSAPSYSVPADSRRNISGLDTVAYTWTTHRYKIVDFDPWHIRAVRIDTGENVSILWEIEAQKEYWAKLVRDMVVDITIRDGYLSSIHFE